MVLDGLFSILTPQILLYILIATIGGLIVGALPGLTATMAVAVMVPLTFGMTPTTGLSVLGAIYMSAIYGGCFSAILINTPGTPGSIATAFDGYPMCVKGEGMRAIVGATVASVVGGIISMVFLFFLSPPLAAVSLKFGPPEYFWLSIFGLTVMASMGGEGSLVKTFIAGGLGLLVSMIGVTIMGGELRFGFNNYHMQGGIDLVSAMIGLFCIPEALNYMSSFGSMYDIKNPGKETKSIMKAIVETLRLYKTIIRSSIIGVIVGILPGAGGTIANMIAYNEAKRTSPDKDKFGTGVLEGVVAPETANNATVGAGLIPTLTLGVPGTSVAAVIYGALLLHGLRPGAELFTANGKIVWGFMFAILISTLLMGVIGILAGVPIYKSISKVPTRFMAPAIVALSVVGSYAVRNNPMDVVVMIVFGLIGSLMKELGLAPGAMVLGLILGPIAEAGYVRSSLMGMAQGMVKTFITRPICLILIGLTLMSLIWPVISKWLAGRKKVA